MLKKSFCISVMGWRRCLPFKPDGDRYRAASTGSLKLAHHFGRTRFSNLGEQFTRQDWVTHSSNPDSLRSFGPCETADLAAGDIFSGRA
jgi:hypothetical protein